VAPGAKLSSSPCPAVTRSDDDRHRGRDGRPGKPETVWRYVFEPDGDGGTRVTESFQLVKPLGAVSNLVTRVTTGVKDRRADLEANIRVSLARLKAIAEP
jgi:hypothetical protein